jgi:nicotinate-nucleotide adenylyltransferase
VFGGTFDPIHNTHLNIARTALTQASLDRLLFVVAGTPPHKRHATIASPEDRFAMVEAAVADESGMEASRIELDRPGPSFTVDTLALLHDQFPDAALYLVLGMDALIDLPKWRAPERIKFLARLLVVPRPGEWDIPDSMNGHYEMLDFCETEISSTEIRRRIVAGKPLDEFLPAAVSRLIREKGIYRSCPLDVGGENAGA